MEQANPRRKRIVAFDVIAIFSCLCVTIVHFNASISGYNGTFQYPNSLISNFYFDGTVYLGSIGVSLFFMLSGARQMYTYKDVKTFFSRRVATLYPMFWIAWIVAILADFLTNKGIGTERPYLMVFSLLGMDGYLASLGLLSFDYYRLGEWFLGCIICLYCVFSDPTLATQENTHRNTVPGHCPVRGLRLAWHPGYIVPHAHSGNHAGHAVCPFRDAQASEGAAGHRCW